VSGPDAHPAATAGGGAPAGARWTGSAGWANPGWADPTWIAVGVDLARPGAIVVVDNVVRHGTVADTASEDPDVIGTQEMLNLVAFADVLDATVLQTVGLRGYDGFLVGIVR